MTPKENFYAMINGGEPEYAPCFTVDFNASVLITNNADQPWQGGVDPFGVTWSMTHEGPIPKPGDFMFTEISDWEKYVKFPDVDSLGLEQMAAIERQNMDPNKPTVMMSVCGIFERMAAFMGFENTLIALAEDPEECMRFAEAFANDKIAVIERGIDLVHPDMVALFDDVATARGLFMSPECWRRVIKPFDKKIADAVRAKGIIFCMHTCGKCEDIVDDYVEIGAQWWNSAQPMNDLKKIMEKHAGRLVVDGGWDSEGPAIRTPHRKSSPKRPNAACGSMPATKTSPSSRSSSPPPAVPWNSARSWASSLIRGEKESTTTRARTLSRSEGHLSVREARPQPVIVRIRQSSHRRLMAEKGANHGIV